VELELAGRHALVTGSSRGTGTAIVRALAAEGATVFVHGNGPGDQEAIAADLVAAGGVAHAVTGDIATDEGADQVIDGVSRHTAGLDVLVNNFGVPAAGRWGDAKPSDWVDVYQSNTLSAVRMIDRFVPAMRERRRGRVIQIATIGVTRPGHRMPHYYASKAALANLTVSLSKELAGTGVTVNTVSPGLIRTAELELYFRSRAERKGWGTDWADIEAAAVAEMMPNPLRRMARIEEVADLVTFLASERAAYINGANLRIDGGATDTVQS
jgi:NAD(P)-dependent dehydrogenase (short-subunit alcohol dehydrogenase family)